MTQTNLRKAFRHHIKSFKTRTGILFIFIYKTRQDRDYACESFLAYFSCIFLAWLGEMRGVLHYPNATAVSNPRLRSTYCTVHCIVCCLHVVHDRQLLVFKRILTCQTTRGTLRKVLMVAGNTVYNGVLASFFC